MSTPSLRSSRGKHDHPEPSEHLDLKALVEAQDPMPTCTCDLCEPAPYRDFLNCFLRPHYRIKLEEDTRKNKFGKKCFLPMKPSAGLIQPEAMHLVRRTIDHFDRRLEQLNNTQLRALKDINRWKDAHIADILGKHDCIDFEKLISEQEMRQLLRWINELFFGRDSWRLRFRWRVKLDSDGVASHPGPFRCIIQMRTWMPYEDTCRDRWIVSLLGTLLHEAVHIHLKMHSCLQWCSADSNTHIQGGYGRAWQLLAAKMERCFVLRTGLPVDLGRFISFKQYWQHLHVLPSLHDLQEWNFENEILVQFYAAEVMEAYEACSKPGEFCLTESAKNWWMNPPGIGIIVLKDGCDWYKLLKKGQQTRLCDGTDDTEEDHRSCLMIRRAPFDVVGEWYTVAFDAMGKCSQVDCLIGASGSIPWKDSCT